MGEVVELPKKDQGVEIEVVMFEADKIDLFGVCYSRETLIREILPKVLKKDKVVDAWMDGDKLVARIKKDAK